MDIEDVRVGDAVEIDDESARSFSRVGNSYGSLTIQPGTPLTVTRIYRQVGEIIVRGSIVRTGGGITVDGSVQGPAQFFRLIDPNRPLPRKLGKKPEGDEYIDINHPGIQWLFDDMGAYATKEGYCPQYDALCAKLGIPGRPREFTVTTMVRGIKMSATVSARSQREANEQVAQALQPAEVSE